MKSYLKYHFIFYLRESKKYVCLQFKFNIKVSLDLRHFVGPMNKVACNRFACKIDVVICQSEVLPVKWGGVNKLSLFTDKHLRSVDMQVEWTFPMNWPLAFQNFDVGQH